MNFEKLISKLAILALCLGLLLTAASCQQSRGRKRKALFQLGSVPKIAVFISGAQSAIKEQRAHLIQTKAQWNSLQSLHNLKRDSQVFNVDFKEYSVLAVFEGQSVNASSHSQLTFKRIDGRVRARLKLDDFQSGPKAIEVSVYSFAIIEKTDDEIFVEIGDPGRTQSAGPQWKEVPLKALKN